MYGLTRSKTGWHRTDKVSPFEDLGGCDQHLEADSQTITKLVRMTIEGQIPPLIIACAFLIEFSKPSSLQLFRTTRQRRPSLE